MRKITSGVPKPSVKAKRTTELEAFVTGAPRKETLPWQEPHVRDDLHVQVNMRQPEKLVLQVEWLAQLMGETKRAVVELALSEWVHRELSKRGIKDTRDD